MKPFILSLLFPLFSYFAHAQDRFITVTSGGGFTGVVTVYKVDDAGRVLKGKGVGEIVYTEQARVKKAIIKKCFRKAKAMFSSTPGFIHPGNLYYSIALTGKNTESRITWGDNEHTVPEDAKKLYQELSSILTSLTYNVIPPKQM